MTDGVHRERGVVLPVVVKDGFMHAISPSVWTRVYLTFAVNSSKCQHLPHPSPFRRPLNPCTTGSLVPINDPPPPTKRGEGQRRRSSHAHLPQELGGSRRAPGFSPSHDVEQRARRTLRQQRPVHGAGRRVGTGGTAGPGLGKTTAKGMFSLKTNPVSDPTGDPQCPPNHTPSLPVLLSIP